MTDQLLAELRDYIEPEFVDNKHWLHSVHVLDSVSVKSLLLNNHLPTILISSVREGDANPDFAMTRKRIYTLKLELVARSQESNAYMVQPVSGTSYNLNIYALSEELREWLYKKKKLVTGIFSMEKDFECSDLNTLSTANGHFTNRNIFVNYTKMETYFGTENSQSNLEIPPTQPEEVYVF